MAVTTPSSTSFVNEPTDYMADKTAEYVKSEAFKQVEKFLAPQKSIIKIKSSLTLLMGRYNKERSYLAALVDGYGQASWLEKATVGLAFLALGTIIGALVQLTAVLAILASCLYLVMHFFIMDEFNIKTARETQLAADMKAQEKSLEQTAETLNECIKEMDALSQQTHAHNLQFASDISRLEKQISAFETQIATYKLATTDLKAAKDELEKINETLKVDLNETRLSLQTTIDKLNAQITSLNSNTEKLDTTNADLLERNDELARINQKLQASLATMTGFEARCEELVSAFEARNIEDAEISESIRASVSDTIACIRSAEDTMKESDRVCEELHQQRLRFFPPGSEIDTDALIARVDAQIAALTGRQQDDLSYSPGH